ncbi:MAG: sugar phosphate isomerase/epimerase [Chloroflexi bacterium]|nr:sugar phosphate isomerase/epimerase [Chloroflexota bacterium]
MPIACATTAFSRRSLEDALAAVRELGFSKVDLLAVEGWAHLMPSELVKDYDGVCARLNNAFKANHLSLATLNIGFSPALYDRSCQAIVTRLSQAKAIVRLMLEHRVCVATLQPGGRAKDRSFEQGMSDSAESLRELVDVAEGTGVTFALECHSGSVAESVPSALELLERVPGLKVDYDPSHAVMQSIDLEDTEPLMDRAAIVHLRDASPEVMQTRYGEGTTDFDWVLKRLRARRFRGIVGVEYLDTEGQEDIGPDIKALYQKIMEYFTD